jgi:PAS domain S-box-containing protein
MNDTSFDFESEMAEIDAIYRTAPIGLCVIDRNLRYVRLNQRLAEMNGVPASDHIGRTVRDIVPHLADHLEPLLRQVIETGVAIIGLEVQGETTAQPAKKRIWVESYAPLRNTAGQVVGVNVSAEEVTELRRLEAERTRHAQLRALASHRESVLEAERTRVARELHDELGHALTAMKLGLEWLVVELGSDAPAPVRDRLQSLLTLARTTMRSAHRISEALRPPMLDDIGLVATIRAHVAAFEAQTTINSRVTAPRRELALRPDTATAIFRIVQEALTNVARHAEATWVDVIFREKADALLVEVHDNGRGITEAARDDPRALGLLGMRERALAVGGTVTIHGTPGRGTTVTVVFARAATASPP